MQALGFWARDVLWCLKSGIGVGDARQPGDFTEVGFRVSCLRKCRDCCETPSLFSSQESN